jgi:hypothetical protein
LDVDVFADDLCEGRFDVFFDEVGVSNWGVIEGLIMVVGFEYFVEVCEDVFVFGGEFVEEGGVFFEVFLSLDEGADEDFGNFLDVDELVIFEVLEDLFFGGMGAFCVEEVFEDFVDGFEDDVVFGGDFFVEVVIFEGVDGTVGEGFFFEVDEALEVDEELIGADAVEFHAEEEGEEGDFLVDSGEGEYFLKEVFDFFLRDVLQAVLPVHFVNEDGVERVVRFLEVDLDLVPFPLDLPDVVLHQGAYVFGD